MQSGLPYIYKKNQINNLSDFVIEVDTTISGETLSNEFKVNSILGECNIDAYQNGILVQSFTNVIGGDILSFTSGGYYELRFISPNEINPISRLVFHPSLDCLKIKEITQWGDIIWSSMLGSFRGCANLGSKQANDTPNLIVCESLGQAFMGSSFNQDINNWNTSNIKDMSFLFRDNSVFNKSLSLWNTSNVTTMLYMFGFAASFNKNISGWNTSKVENMDFMFRNATLFNQDLSTWCVELIPSEPSFFDLNATSWVLPRPNWGMPC